jgi:Thioredoxin-like domain
MDTVTYPDPRVAEFIEQHFAPVRIVIRENRELANKYLVSWTPNMVIADEQGRVHYRIEGYLPPVEFLGRLSLGVGKYDLSFAKLGEAAQRFEEVARRHAKTDAGAEALYWLGVARFKGSHNVADLKSSWEQLAREYPDSEWTVRTKIPHKS